METLANKLTSETLIVAVLVLIFAYNVFKDITHFNRQSVDEVKKETSKALKVVAEESDKERLYNDKVLAKQETIATLQLQNILNAWSHESLDIKSAIRQLEIELKQGINVLARDESSRYNALRAHLEKLESQLEDALKQKDGA